ncbi:MAG: helix-turn-helix transcriptional regulator [Clostridia bacterium]|nr:helix-turn-helix transcriptional regulator [Clostridia bacterium]
MMSIGSTIRKLRRERDMTQEQLAELLGITANAVSQWECDRTAPDISQLPVLARIFHVSADILLEIDLSRKEDEIMELHDTIYKLSQIGKHREAFETARNAHQKYPDDYRLMYAYASHFCYVAGDESYSAEETEHFRTESMKLLENIADGCTDDNLRQHAMSELCWMYRDRGELDKAEEIAEKFPILCSSREFLKTTLYGGNKGIEVTRRLLFVLTEHLSNRMIRNCRTDTGELFFSEDEMCELYQKQIELLRILFEQEDFGFFYDDIREAHKNIANYHAKREHTTETLHHLESAADAVVRYMNDFYKKKYTHTSLLFKGYEENGGGIWYSSNENDAAELLAYIREDKFDFVRQEQRFEMITDRLNALAGKWSL